MNETISRYDLKYTHEICIIINHEYVYRETIEDVLFSEARDRVIKIAEEKYSDQDYHYITIKIGRDSWGGGGRNPKFKDQPE